MLPLLLMGYRSAAMVWVTLLFSLGTDLLFAWYVLRVLGEKFVFRGFERRAVRSLLLYTSFIAVNLIADQVNWNVDKVLLGRFRGTGEVAVYAVGYTLFQYYMMLSTSVSSVFTPRIHRIIRQTETDTAARRAGADRAVYPGGPGTAFAAGTGGDGGGLLRASVHPALVGGAGVRRSVPGGTDFDAQRHGGSDPEHGHRDARAQNLARLPLPGIRGYGGGKPGAVRVPVPPIRRPGGGGRDGGVHAAGQRTGHESLLPQALRRGCAVLLAVCGCGFAGE